MARPAGLTNSAAAAASRLLATRAWPPIRHRAAVVTHRDEHRFSVRVGLLPGQTWDSDRPPSDRTRSRTVRPARCGRSISANAGSTSSTGRAVDIRCSSPRLIAVRVVARREDPDRPPGDRPGGQREHQPDEAHGDHDHPDRHAARRPTRSQSSSAAAKAMNAIEKRSARTRTSPAGGRHGRAPPSGGRQLRATGDDRHETPHGGLRRRPNCPGSWCRRARPPVTSTAYPARDAPAAGDSTPVVGDRETDARISRRPR